MTVPGADPVPVSDNLLNQEHRRLLAEHFDAGYYKSCLSDEEASGLDPLDHFLSAGWREGRNPNAQFDTEYYRLNNPDVARAGLNPFVHYLLEGRREGRQPRRALDAVRRRLEASASPRSRAGDWHAAADRSQPMRGSWLVEAVGRAAAPGGLIVSISHDDYAVHFGGVQNLVGDEQVAFAAAGAGYLHLSPAAPLPLLADTQPATEFRVRVRLDGQALGVAVLSDVVQAVSALDAGAAPVVLTIHHLMGWAPEAVATLAARLARPTMIWLHDFFSLCSSYALMRNDVVFCHAPPTGSVACQICSFGEERAEHVARMKAFFAAVRPFVLAPSRPALDFWLEKASLEHAGAAVVPLARLLLSNEGEDEVPQPPARRPLRVAFIGARLMHKGWTVFQDLALSLAGDERYAFYHLGVDLYSPLPEAIRNVPVRVTADGREAMIEAIAEHAIDVVVSWSLWPETFCFAVHEAIAGGAFVVARSGAGNLWPAVKEHAPSQGCPVNDEPALLALFSTGAIRSRVAEGRRLRGALLPGRGTADWLLRGRMRLGDPPMREVSADA